MALSKDMKKSKEIQGIHVIELHKDFKFEIKVLPYVWRGLT